MRRTSVPRLVTGGLLLVLAGPIALAAMALLWINVAERDDDGWYRSETVVLETDTYALTSERLDLHTGASGRDRTPFDLGTVRVDVERTDGRPVFVGIAPEADVDRYLADSAHDEIDELRLDGSRARYERSDGERRPPVPSGEDFWVRSVEGSGRQRLTWDVDGGDWAVVVMDPDARPGLEVRAAAALHTDLLLPIGLALAGLAALLGLGGGLLLATGAGSTSNEGSTGATPPPARGELVQLRGTLDEHHSRWLWLVKWLLALPHLVVLALLWPVFVVLTIVAGASILVRGVYPARLFDLNVGVMRWTWRVTFYAFVLGTDRYPPFSLRPDDDYPADLLVERPPALSRSLVLVKWLLAVPHYLVIAIFGGGLTFWFLGRAGEGDAVVGGGLVGLLALIAGCALLFTGRYPRAIFDFVMGMERWIYRVLVYAALLRDEYPPFRLDLGGGAPSPASPGSSLTSHAHDAHAA